VSCWGYDYYDVTVPPPGTFKQITSEAYSACGLRTDDTIECWGYSGYGLLDEPYGNFQKVSAGGNHACGLREDRTLVCWGQDLFGMVSNAPPGTFRDVSAGSYHTCAVRDDGTITCWGWNKYGILTPAPGRFEKVAVGHLQGCAISEIGFIECWGEQSVTTQYWGNVAPVVTGLLLPGEPIPAGGLAEVSATFTDDDLVDVHTALFEWGDGSSSPGAVLQEPVPGIPGIAEGAHVYDLPGVYTVSVTITDTDGLSDSRDSSQEATYQYLVVYDPSAGFVTGGGWIVSPEGAYQPDPALTGKATFGFVSKYVKTKTVPVGNTEFRFKAGGLNFRSSSYEWLVVTGSDFARFKGTGTINGEGEYKFMIWAGDGDPDTFRIKIWEEVGEVESIVYDNGMDQEIGGGSIVVHTGKK